MQLIAAGRPGSSRQPGIANGTILLRCTHLVMRARTALLLVACLASLRKMCLQTICIMVTLAAVPGAFFSQAGLETQFLLLPLAGDQILFQIIKGRLYVDFKTSNRAMSDVGTRGADGWFPGNEGAGEVACMLCALQIQSLKTYERLAWRVPRNRTMHSDAADISLLSLALQCRPGSG